MIFFLCYFLIVGASLYFYGSYIKKKPYLSIQDDFQLSKIVLSPEAVEIYAKRTSIALQVIGIFHIICAVVHYFLRDTEFSIAMAILSWIPFLAYMMYARKKLVGKLQIWLVIFLSLSFLLPLAFIASSYIESSVIVDDNEIRITGRYGERIPISQLNDVFLSNELPNISIRTNGISIGRINKGYFRSRSLERNVKLLLHSRSAPFIYIIYGDNDKHVIVNFRNKERTLEVYEQLRVLVGK